MSNFYKLEESQQTFGSEIRQDGKERWCRSLWTSLCMCNNMLCHPDPVSGRQMPSRRKVLQLVLTSRLALGRRCNNSARRQRRGEAFSAKFVKSAKKSDSSIWTMYSTTSNLYSVYSWGQENNYCLWAMATCGVYSYHSPADSRRALCVFYSVIKPTVWPCGSCWLRHFINPSKAAYVMIASGNVLLLCTGEESKWLYFKSPNKCIGFAGPLSHLFRDLITLSYPPYSHTNK